MGQQVPSAKMAKQHKLHQPPRLDCQARLPSILQPADRAWLAGSITCSLDPVSWSSPPAVLLFNKHPLIGTLLHPFVVRTPSVFRSRFFMQQECINISHSITALRGDVHLCVINCLITKFYAEFQSAKLKHFKLSSGKKCKHIQKNKLG